MTATVVLGLAWGDEGKGRVCDALASDAHFVSRYSGGNNAGHTVRVGEEEFKLHLIPSGIVREDVVCTIGNGVVVNPEVLVEEVEALEARGISVRNRLKIDGRAHLIMPYHIALDSHREIALGDARIGTTNRGIGPAYEDKVARYGLRVQDISDEGILKTKLKAALREKNSIFQNVYGKEPYDISELASWLRGFEAAAEWPRTPREGPARRLPGHPPGYRPRHVSVRDVLQPDGRGGRHGFRHSSWATRVRRRRDQGLHDAGRGRADADRALRRGGGEDPGGRRRVRDDDGAGQAGRVAGPSGHKVGRFPERDHALRPYDARRALVC